MESKKTKPSSLSEITQGNILRSIATGVWIRKRVFTEKEKEYSPMKDSDEDIVKWRAKKQNLLVYQK